MSWLEWLDTATKKILFRPDRKAVRRELEAHLEDLREASGLDEETAVASMGDPAALAEELSRLHRPWWGYLWRASQIVLAGTAVFCCLLAVLAEAVCQPLDRLGTSLHNYLTPVQFTGALEERDIPAGRSGGLDGGRQAVGISVPERRCRNGSDSYFHGPGERNERAAGDHG